MISLEKWLTLIPLQKLPKNVGDLGKIIVAIGFKKLSKVQYIAQSGHNTNFTELLLHPFSLCVFSVNIFQ